MATSSKSTVSSGDLSFEGSDSASLMKLLDCPVCMEVPAPPILMCIKGHSICEACRNLIPRCPLCDEEFSTVRNVLAEELVEKLKRKCPNAKDGCNKVVKAKDWETHLLQCDFRQVECDLQQTKSCKGVKMNFKTYWKHLKNIHNIQGVNGAIINVKQFVTFEQSGLTQELPRGYWPTQYMEACNEIFLTGTASVLGKIYWWVSIIGGDKHADKYTAKISLLMKSKGLETSWTGPVHSFRKCPAKILSEGMCLLAIPETLLPYTHMKLQLNGNAQGEALDNPSVGWNIVYSVIKKVNQQPLPSKNSSDTANLGKNLTTLNINESVDTDAKDCNRSSNASQTSSTRQSPSITPVSMVRSRMKKGQSMGNLV